MVSYLKVRWHHELPEEPVWLFSELDDERYEVRKVELYRDGTGTFADASRHSGSTMLGEIPAPSVAEFLEFEEFSAFEIERSEFEAQWTNAVGSEGRGEAQG